MNTDAQDLASFIASHKAQRSSGKSGSEADKKAEFAENQLRAAQLVRVLDEVIAPKLESACAALHAAAMNAETVRNQSPGGGDPRLTLSLSRAGRAARLSFQVWSYRIPPVITWHVFVFGNPDKTGTFQSGSLETVDQIIRDFLKSALPQ